MPRTGGEKTRQKILTTAERLFAERGFDGTGVERIARAAGVNKALIYYHFRNKDDIVAALFKAIVDEITAQAGKPSTEPPTKSLLRKIRVEVEALADRRRILAIMLMEALKSRQGRDYLLQIADLIMESQATGKRGRRRIRPCQRTHGEQDFLVSEFFTGIIPVLAFITLRERFARYYEIEDDKLLKLFLKAFERSHLANHP